jgi:tRNA(fMet)-specific endonuclease VapC
MRYLLDTNAVIGLANNSHPGLSQRARRQAPQNIAISVVVMYEVYVGAYQSRRRAENLAVADALQFAIIDFDRDDARQAGEVRALLAARGTPIGPCDVLIAGQAVARNLILVTHNTTEFGRVPRLQMEDWEA